MEMVEAHRKECLQQQTELRRIIMKPGQFNLALDLFLNLHARLHSRKMVQAEPWSLEDEILDDMAEERVRRIPPGECHSVAWLIWHIARCEDVTMNLLVAGTPQVLNGGGWLTLTNSPLCDTGNAMDEASIVFLNKTVEIRALRAYRRAIGRRTRQIANQLRPADLLRKVEPARINQVMKEGAVVEAARSIVDYWSRRDVAGLLLMPATRHNLIHLGEALRLKRKGS